MIIVRLSVNELKLSIALPWNYLDATYADKLLWIILTLPFLVFPLHYKGDYFSVFDLSL